MNERKGRHELVSNLDETEIFENDQGPRFGVRLKALGRVTKSERLGCNWFEVAPGKTAFPYHYHCAIEEAVFVLSGTGRLRIGEVAIDVRMGDWITLPPGPEHAHQLINIGAEPLRYLCISSRADADVVGYPDSNKLAAMASPHADFFKPPWVRAVFRADSAVDYLDGEQPD